MDSTKTCPNENCHNNNTEFDFEANYCEHCGTELVVIYDDDDEEVEEEED